MSRDYVAEALGGSSWRDGVITARELQTKQFTPVRIILPDLIPEGLTILAGKPKIGKSFLALDVCMAVAANCFVLGQTKPVQGDALYLALEDSQRRLKKRMDKLMQAQAWPERLQLHTSGSALTRVGSMTLKYGARSILSGGLFGSIHWPRCAR